MQYQYHSCSLVEFIGLIECQSNNRCHGSTAVHHVPVISRLYQLQEWTPHQGAFHVFNSMVQLPGGIFQITDVQDLTNLNRGLSRVIVIDTDSKSIQLQPENGLIMKKWTGDLHDNILELGKFLISKAKLIFTCLLCFYGL